MAELKQNITIIKEIEKSVSNINDNLESLENNLLNNEQPAQKKPPFVRKQTIDKAIEEIDLFQKTTLFELRKTFE